MWYDGIVSLYKELRTLEISAVNLDSLYASLKGVIQPPLKRPADVEREPFILVSVREVCYWMAKAFGWEIKGEVPDHIKKGVIILAPHTSQLDFFLGMATYRHFQHLHGYYLAKKELFRGPFKWLFEKTGGIPIDRSKHNNMIDQVAAFFEGTDRMFLTLAPEGTRSYTKKWKSGFYRIAMRGRRTHFAGLL